MVYDARADPGNCDYREIQAGDPADHPIGCLGVFDGWEAKKPFLWAALLYCFTACCCWYSEQHTGNSLLRVISTAFLTDCLW